MKGLVTEKTGGLNPLKINILSLKLKSGLKSPVVRAVIILFYNP
jgi:hypothetical protein